VNFLGYIPPHRNQVSNEMKQLYKHHIDLLKNELKEIDYIGLTFDFWSNRRSMSFLCITGHWMKDAPPEFVSKIVAYSSFNERHTAANIAQCLKEKLLDLGIYHKIIAITCDGAPNVVAALRLLGIPIRRIWCCAHRLHLVVINSLGLWIKEEDLDNDKISYSTTDPATTIIASLDVISKDEEDAMDISWSNENESSKRFI
jgi:hypothetical protein